MISLCPVLPDDDGWLFELYREIHKSTFESLGAELCETLLRQQYGFQESQYQQQHPNLERSIILLDDEPVGKIYLSRSGGELLLVDIEISPLHQHRGIGTSVLETLISEAKATGQSIRLHVAQPNLIASGWYLKLGFKAKRVVAPYVEMIFEPV